MKRRHCEASLIYPRMKIWMAEAPERSERGDLKILMSQSICMGVLERWIAAACRELDMWVDGATASQ